MLLTLLTMQTAILPMCRQYASTMQQWAKYVEVYYYFTSWNGRVLSGVLRREPSTETESRSAFGWRSFLFCIAQIHSVVSLISVRATTVYPPHGNRGCVLWFRTIIADSAQKKTLKAWLGIVAEQSSTRRVSGLMQLRHCKYQSDIVYRVPVVVIKHTM